jgi:hypothetical protein
VSWELSHPNVASRAGFIDDLRADGARSRLAADRPKAEKRGVLARAVTGWKNHSRRRVELGSNVSQPQDA